MAVKRFICKGGDVVSVNDGQRHYVSARRVAFLHQVPAEECLFVDWPATRYPVRGVDESKFLVLTPHPEAYLKVGPAERKQYPIA